MRKIKLFLATATLAVATSASAQFSSSAQSSSSAGTEGWSTLWVEWNPSTIKYDIKNADDQSFTGLSFGYSQAFNIVQGKPLFLEAGLGVQYSFCTLGDEEDYYYYDEDEEEEKFNMFSAKVPVNLIYKFDIPNSSVALMPFVGANFRYNLSAKVSYGDEDVDLFDKKDMGSSKATWKRFQAGWNIGLKARFGQSFLVGISYGNDFSEIAKKTKISTTTIGIGYTF